MCTLTALTSLVIWLPVHNSAGIVAFAVIFGFGSGTFVSMSPALVAQITKPEQMYLIGTLTCYLSILKSQRPFPPPTIETDDTLSRRHT